MGEAKRRSAAGQQIDMTLSQLTKRVAAFDEAVEGLPPQLRPIAMARHLAMMVVTPCRCGLPECASIPMEALVNSAKAYELHFTQWGGIPALMGVSRPQSVKE